jgi:hypothetical protein
MFCLSSLRESHLSHGILCEPLWRAVWRHQGPRAPPPRQKKCEDQGEVEEEKKSGSTHVPEEEARKHGILSRFTPDLGSASK